MDENGNNLALIRYRSGGEAKHQRGMDVGHGRNYNAKETEERGILNRALDDIQPQRIECVNIPLTVLMLH